MAGIGEGTRAVAGEDIEAIIGKGHATILSLDIRIKLGQASAASCQKRPAGIRSRRWRAAEPGFARKSEAVQADSSCFASEASKRSAASEATACSNGAWQWPYCTYSAARWSEARRAAAYCVWRREEPTG